MALRADKYLDLFLDSDAIDEDFFAEVVENKLKIKRDEFHLRFVAITPATGKNENFMSVVLRAAIKIEFRDSKAKQSIDVIIKALLREVDENVKDLGVFKRERFVYEKIIDSFESIWLRNGESVQFAPKCFKVTQEPFETIILDDLRNKNFLLVDRKHGFNLEQSELVLKKLAKFHAAGAIYLHEHGAFDDCLDRKLSMKTLNQDGDIVREFGKFFHVFLETIKNLDGCSEFGEKVAKWDLNKLYKCWMLATEPMKNGFVVLNHGDMWVNNLLLSTDDALFIDFQICFHGSPASDLIYFLVTSVSDDVKVANFDHLVRIYHSELCNGLQKLDYEKQVPTLEEIHQDMLEKGSFACSRLMLLLLIVKNDAREEFDLSDLLNSKDSNLLKSAYQSEIYRKALKSWLPFFDERGYLDCVI